MTERLPRFAVERYVPQHIDLVPASTARPGETIDVFTHPTSQPGKQFSMKVEAVKSYEFVSKAGNIVSRRTVYVIGKDQRNIKTSITGGTAIAKEKRIGDSVTREERMTYRRRGNVRITTIR